MTNDARNPDAATLAREALYICRPDGFTAERVTEPTAVAELAAHGWAPVVFKAVLIRPRACPINGEYSEPYYARVPHRPDGKQLTLR